ncbi:phosphatase PAP2 family protein [Selenomonas sp. F0473]|uniref:phosphatase PAP2 family protein n=1 Tax=Selenomonas sp. F0473 TaxID=999423 RepID=UPI00029E3FDF|nr:phosphatase PAP2 family protein [Selenomonas sp. F0473]EKU71129.1 hypothetical protein HMPREF9161_01223 [Selenomonas sp. F0473]
MDMVLGWDTAAIFWVQEHIVRSWLTPWMIGAASLGDLHSVGVIWGVLAVALIYTRRYRRAGIAAILALLFCLIVGDLAMKNIFMRERPCVTYPLVSVLANGGPTNYSFPSGHTFGAFAMAAALARGVRRPVGAALLSVAAVIGFSRIYLFVHYPTDVIAGAALGIFFGYLSWYLAGALVPKIVCRAPFHHER